MKDNVNKVVKDFIKYLGERNLTELTQLFSETVDWYIPGDETKATWLGIRNTRQEVSDFYELLWKNTQPISANIDNIFADEENAVIVGEFSTKMVKTNNILNSLFCIQMRIQNNKIVRYRLLEDSFKVSKSLTE
jgi:ketosteroid isomerase-like protein